MNTKTARQIEEMKKQTIGVEIEMNSISRSKAAKLASQFFGTGRYKNTADRNGYCTYSAWDEQGREWKFQKDVSIAGIDSEKCEMVTPILNYSDIETLQELVRILRKAGAKSDSTRGCGVHIHIGAKGHTAKTLSQMAKEVKSASAKPQQTENPKYAMRTWLLRLGFIGDEFKTARDVFTSRLSGDTAFRNGRVA